LIWAVLQDASERMHMHSALTVRVARMRSLGVPLKLDS